MPSRSSSGDAGPLERVGERRAACAAATYGSSRTRSTLCRSAEPDGAVAPALDARATRRRAAWSRRHASETRTTPAAPSVTWQQSCADAALDDGVVRVVVASRRRGPDVPAAGLRVGVASGVCEVELPRWRAGARRRGRSAGRTRRRAGRTASATGTRRPCPRARTRRRRRGSRRLVAGHGLLGSTPSTRAHVVAPCPMSAIAASSATRPTRRRPRAGRPERPTGRADRRGHAPRWP